MKTLYVILPCYNEQNSIEILINKWFVQKPFLNRRGFDIKIIVIDDKSTDNTRKIIEKQSVLHDEILPLYFAENKGLGSGLIAGLMLFENKSIEEDIVIVMDADNTHDPCYVSTMIDRIEAGYDCVIASRYCLESKTFGLPLYRSILTICARIYYQLVLGIPNVKDYTCGFRAYSANIIKKAYAVYKESMVEEKSFACMMELLYKLHSINARIIEIPFELRYDFKEGNSKMKIIDTILKSFTTAFKLKFIEK